LIEMYFQNTKTEGGEINISDISITSFLQTWRISCYSSFDR
jgi:hypothetical protein